MKTKEDFIKLSAKADSTKTPQHGILGISPLAKILIIPDQCPYDYMHLLLQGHVKWFMDRYFFDKDSEVYLGNLIFYFIY